MRTLTTAAATCSLLAVSFLAACGEDARPDPDAEGTPTVSGPASPSTSPPASPPASPSASESAGGGDPTRLTTRGLPQGEAPQIAYIAADDPAAPLGTWSLVRGDGDLLALPLSGPSSFALMGNGLVLLGPDSEGSTVSVVNGSGEEVRREAARGYNLAVTADRSIVAWLGDEGQTAVLEAGGQRTYDLPSVEQADDIAAILGEGTCQEAASPINGCTAFLNTAGFREAYLTSSHGIVDLAGSMLSVSDASSDGRLLGIVSLTDEGSCSGLYVERRAPAWQTCDHTLTGFSPDGTRVLGTDAYLDGFGQRSVVFLDASGSTLHEFLSRGRGATVLQTVWEDADHVLAVLYERGLWSIARLGVDGSAELALGPVAGSDLDRPFALEQS